jgi:hypothetical protein
MIALTTAMTVVVTGAAVLVVAFTSGRLSAR